MNRKERQEARVDRYRELANRNQRESTAVINQSIQMADIIPMGQPVHGAADRRYREKIGAKMDKGIGLSRKAEYYEQKATAAENNHSIYLEDDDAVERLQAKVEYLEKSQGMMKSANKVVRSKKLSDIGKVEQLQAIGFSEEKAIDLLKPSYCGEIGFPSYMLTNNNAKIRNAKERLGQATRLKNTTSKEYVVNDVRFEENTEDNLLQLFFDGIPSEEVRAELKHNGFRWSRYNECWQSYLNRWQIGRAKAIIENLDQID